MANVNVDDILDDMSLSDDEMLDNLADDMLMELEADASDEEIEEIHTASSTRNSSSNNNSAHAAAMPMGFPAATAGGGMPDLGKMMSQMMPMMSQMFGGGAQTNANTLRGPQQSWEDVVRQHVPANEQREWLDTIARDEQVLRAAAQRTRKPSSRAYRQNANPLPNVYMEVEPLLASLLNESVRAAHSEHNGTWHAYHDNLVSQLTRSGLTDVFARELKAQLRARVASDPDFAAERNSERFAFIEKALFV